MVSFDDIPKEILRNIIGYMDIPSLCTLSMTCKPAMENHNISALAIDDTTWYALIQSRFGIGCNHRRISIRSKQQKNNGVVIVKRGSSSSLSSSVHTEKSKRRPKSYGGSSWKDAYRNLASTMRIPETSICGSHMSGCAIFASPILTGRRKINTLSNYLGIHVLVNHSENCRTKTVDGHSGRRRHRRRNGEVAVREPIPYRADKRYIELKLCLQNTTSGIGRVVIPDVSSICIASLDEEAYFESWGWDKWDNDYDSTFKLITVGPWAPRIILRRKFTDSELAQDQAAIDAEEWNAKSSERDIILRPFEVVVLSIHISCPESFVWETDALSSMSMIRVPVAAADGWSSKNSDENEAAKKTYVSTARFLVEDEIWDYYCQLPGGCLSLTDRSRLVPM